MLQRFAWLRRLAIELNARQVKGILHAHDVALEFTPAIGVRRRAIVGSEMPVERGQDTRELVLNAAPALSAAKERVPSPFLPLHPHAHHPSLTLHLEEEDLAGDDRDGFAAWRRNGPLA